MRYLRHLFLTISGLLLVCSAASAQLATGPADVYEVKIAKVELYNSTTTEWTTVYSGSSSAIDIAAGASGAAAGEFLSGLAIPDGVYTKAKITPGTTFVIQGSFAGGFHTTSGTADAEGRTVSVASNLGDPAPCPVTILPDDANAVGAIEQDFSGTPITVVNGNADKKIRVLFDVSEALTFDDGFGVIYPNPPEVSVTIN